MIGKSLHQQYRKRSELPSTLEELLSLKTRYSRVYLEGDEESGTGVSLILKAPLGMRL